jgi:hypothetical protein
VSSSLSRPVRAYLIAQAVALVAYWLVPPTSWVQPIWQTLAMSISAAFLVLGVRRLRPEAPLAWYFLAAGVFLNGCGVTVDMVAHRFFGVVASPNAADAFWSALFPAGAVGLGLLLRRAVAREELSTTLRNTLVCVSIVFFTSIYAWQFVAWRSYYAERVPLAYKVMVSAYPFGDLVFMALLLRLALSVGLRNVSLWLMLGWLILLFPSDLGWPMFARAGTTPGRGVQYFMEATWMAACALLGAATWHPDVRKLVHSTDERATALGGFGWLGLLACALVGPLVVIFQVVLDRVYLLTSF